MTFEGNNLSLVCYHGINLRSKSWVVFIMQEPGVSFSTEAQEVITEGQLSLKYCGHKIVFTKQTIMETISLIFYPSSNKFNNRSQQLLLPVYSVNH